jgi:hypothetical protein
VSGLWTQFKEEVFPKLTQRQQEGAYQAFAWLEERMKIPPEDISEKMPPDRFLVVIMPDGKEFTIDVRAVSVAYSNAKLKDPVLRESFDCFGSNSAIDAGPNFARKFRELDDVRVIEEARKLPLDDMLALYMGQGQRFFSLMNLDRDNALNEFLKKNAMNAAEFLRIYRQGHWAAAAMRVEHICACGDHLEKESEKKRGTCNQCCTFDELAEDGQ